jgi:hypothetical protein
MIENEFRVRPVTRYALTHYRRDERGSGVTQMGEFPNVQGAEAVGVALHAIVPGSTLVTLEGRVPLSPNEVFGLTCPPASVNPLASRYAIGERVACVGYQYIVKHIKFTPGKIFYGLAFGTNPDGEVIEYPSEDVYPLAALGIK